MRTVTQRRLRGEGSMHTEHSDRSSITATRARQNCPICESGGELHAHCQICCAPLEGFSRKTCGGECRQILKSARRKARSVRCWITVDDGSGRRLRRWLPWRFVMPRDTGVSKASGAPRAIFPAKPTDKPRRTKLGILAKAEGRSLVGGNS